MKHQTELDDGQTNSYAFWMKLLSAKKCFLVDRNSALGKNGCSKLDEVSEKFQRGWFSIQIYVADFWNFKQDFLSIKLIQKSQNVARM